MFTKEKPFILRYQFALATMFLLAFFTNFDTYLSYAIGTPPPKFWIVTFAIASTPLILSRKERKNYIPKAILFWVYGYFTLSLISFILYSSDQLQSSIEELNNRILSVIFILTSLLVFSKDFRVQHWSRLIILVITFMNVITNITGLLYPEAFVTIIESQSALETGRSAGFYVDANRAGCVLIIGMIFCIGLFKQRYRLPFALIILVGILVTYSRSALISFLIVIVILISKREISSKNLFTWFSIVGFTIWLLLSPAWFNQQSLGGLEDVFLENKNLDRITNIYSGSDNTTFDESALSRAYIAELTWQKFLQSPILGNGIGYGLELANETGLGIRSHNMYLSYMVEHGFLGALILPLLVLFSTKSSCKKTKGMNIAFATLIFFWGFVSHNILEQHEFLISFSLISTMNITNQLQQTSTP